MKIGGGSARLEDSQCIWGSIGGARGRLCLTEMSLFSLKLVSIFSCMYSRTQVPCVQLITIKERLFLE